ncbi:MAG: hypothetical protein ACI9K2_006605 [Myxococcota bacterium]|jgi:hypothetical protein
MILYMRTQGSKGGGRGTSEVVPAQGFRRTEVPLVAARNVFRADNVAIQNKSGALRDMWEDRQHKATKAGSSRLASRRTNTSGRSRTPVRPERQGCLNRMHTRPSSSTDRRWSDTGT